MTVCFRGTEHLANNYLFRGGEDQLLDWLNNYTFPTEARFKDTGYATRVYPDIVNRVINSGVSCSSHPL